MGFNMWKRLRRILMALAVVLAATAGCSEETTIEPGPDLNRPRPEDIVKDTGADLAVPLPDSMPGDGTGTDAVDEELAAQPETAGEELEIPVEEVVEEELAEPGCKGNPDCEDPDLPYCLQEEGECVQCLHISHCADGDYCNEDACQDNVCVYAPGELENCCNETADCDDGNVCTEEICENNVCLYDGQPDCCVENVECDDGNPCTADMCTDSACENVLIADCCVVDGDCDDGFACTVDLCEDNVCNSILDLDCCMKDSDCDDGDDCTVDGCFDSVCVSQPIADCCNQASDCDDADDCTLDSCSPQGKCMHVGILDCCSKDADCDDDDPCTIDTCVDGACVSNGGKCVTLIPTQDVWLESVNANKNGFDFLIVGKTGEFVKKRTLVQFKTPKVPADEEVVSATLSLYYFVSTKPGWDPDEKGIDRTIQVHRMLVPWVEHQATSKFASFNVQWSTVHVGLNDIDAETEALDSGLWVCQDYGWNTFDVTDAVKSWVADADSNYGLLVWATNENQSGMDMRFYSREHDEDETLRPKLTVVIGKDVAIPIDD